VFLKWIKEHILKKADELIQIFLESINAQDTKGYGTFLNAWKTIVGLDYWSHCKPQDIKKGNLILEVDHPGWHQKFKMEEKKFIREIQQKFPQLEIKRFSYIYVETFTKTRSSPPQIEQIEQSEQEVTEDAALNQKTPENPDRKELDAILSRLEKALKANAND